MQVVQLAGSYDGRQSLILLNMSDIFTVIRFQNTVLYSTGGAVYSPALTDFTFMVKVGL